MGGETPIRLIHEAAVRIARGELQAAAIVGGEAMHARGRAAKEKAKLSWTPAAPREAAVQFPSSRLIGRASCRERGWQYVYLSVVARSIKKTTRTTRHTKKNT